MERQRRRRILVVAALAVLTLVVMLLPPFQTAVVRGLVAGVEGADISLDRVAVGPWGARVDNLHLIAPGLELEVPRADVNLAFWSSLGHLSLDIEELAAPGIRMTIARRLEAPKIQAQPVEFNGLAPVTQLPGRLAIRRADADGSIELVVSDTVSLVGTWKLTATGVGSNRQLESAIEAALEGVRDDETFAAARVSATATAAVDADGAVTALAADAGLHAESDEPLGIDARVSAELADDEESYRLVVDGAGGHRLIDVTAEFDPDRRVLTSRWEASVTPGLVTAFARGRPLPDLSLSSAGTVTVDLDRGRLELDGNGHAEGRGWADLDPRLRGIDELVADAVVVATMAGSHLDAKRLELGLAGPDGRPILRVEAVQPVEVDLEDWRFTPQAWGQSALRFEADRVPLRWTRGFDPKVVVEAGELSAAIDVVPMDPRRTVVASHEPIRVADLRLRAAGGDSTSRNLDLVLEPRITLDNGTLEAVIERARLTAATGLDVRFGGRATTSNERWPVVGLTGEISMHLPKLQRSVESIDRIKGRARFDLDLGDLVLAVDDAALGVVDPSGHPMVAIRFDNEEALPLALPSMTPDWAAVTPQRVVVDIDGFPIGWVSPFIPELEVDGGALFGELEAVGGGGLGLTLEPTEPFEIRDLRPVYRGRAFATGSTASVEPRLHLDNQAVRVDLDNLSVHTPDGDRLDGELTFVAPLDGRRRIDASIAVDGAFPTVTDRIGRLGALSWRQKAVIDVARRRLEVTDLGVALTDAAENRFLELSSTRPFVIDADPFGVRVDGGPPDILRVTITPLELQELFPRVLGFGLEGVLPRGEFVGRAEDGGLLLVADDPLVFRDVTVRWDEAALLDRVTIGLEYRVLYSNDGLQARSIDFETLGPDGRPIADATLRAVMPLTDRTILSSLHFETVAELESLARQPIFRGLPVFVTGTVGGSLDLERGDRSTLGGKVTLRDAAIDDGRVLPDLDASLDVVGVAGERLEISAPVRLDSDANGSSDLRFQGEVVRTGDGLRVDAALTGDRIATEDVVALVGLATRPDPDAGPSEPRESVASAFRERWSKDAIAQLRERRDASPVWGSRVSGRADLRLGTVQLPRYEVHSVEGRLEVDPTRIELVDAGASLLGAELAMEGALRFDSEAEQPYVLSFRSSFEGLDLGRLFREVDPDAPPTLEGLFEVRAAASGRGRNLADLGLGTLGAVRLSGRNGVFRGLAGRYRLVRTGAKVLGFLTFSKQLKAISRLLGELEALEFDTFDLELARQTPRRFAISELRVVSPLAVIDGGGVVEVEPGVPLVASPLDASFDMATRGDLTILFDGLGLLGNDESERGYRPLTRAVTVGGTVSEPDTSAFYEMLDEASRDSKGVVGVAMRRVNKKLQKRR